MTGQAEEPITNRAVHHGPVALTSSIRSTDFLRNLEPWRRSKEIDQILHEGAVDLNALHAAAERRPPQRDSSFDQYRTDDWTSAQENLDEDELIIAGQEVMQAWERPLMHRMAAIATRTHGDVLELGFGMGISATAILAEGVRSYTVIEANSHVAERARAWAAERPDQTITIVEGRWQDRIDELGQFDGIFFDTYPTSEEEALAHNVEDTFYAEHFLPAGARHLRPGGVLTYYTNEIDSLSREHQRIVLRHFTSVEIGVVEGLLPPEDCTYWWATSMAVVALVR
ncbi:class I SAM-dependent methyltransferase [Amycolatopsis panacis]|uniref:Class I SAM-dependent methyltransferase n=1 Tax=Amycolatopsis panacis TaxID=2340917 RepID=A0A419HUP3_9PSEU|nr:class I SAM-dependent methyltransferase [Amycolatopsis panacis]RJQ80606.1 class I SAM-dependent methyltransferase [Amycolatopsis panacis]